MPKPEGKSVTGGPQGSEKSRRFKLAAIMRDRLELDDEWFTVTDRPRFFDKINQKNWYGFETAFKRVVDLGCRWDVLLTCLARFETYNTEEIVLERAKQDAEGEVVAKPKARRQPMRRPPGKDERESIRRSLDAASGRIKRYQDLLFELGRLEAPPSILGPRLSSDEAIVYLPRLLRWCRNLLTNESLGNIRTVESAGRLVICVYVDFVTHEKNSLSRAARPLSLQPVADLLHEIEESAGCDQAELREALRRLQRQYTDVHKLLTEKIRMLHHSPILAPHGWRRLFAEERERRSRLKS
jgi:hypothetical protein